MDLAVNASKNGQVTKLYLLLLLFKSVEKSTAMPVSKITESLCGGGVQNKAMNTENTKNTWAHLPNLFKTTCS